MRINHNIAALNAYRNLEINNENTSKSMEKLSSGLRINHASDDAAGLAISEKMKSQIRGLDMAQRNAMDGISVVQTADGALSSTQDILQRMRELAVQASSDTNTESDRQQIQSEMDQLTSEINRIGNSTEFNTKNLLDGSLTISGDPKQIKPGSTGGTLGSAVTLDPNSVLPDGQYSVDIAKVPGATYQIIGTVTDSTGSTTPLTVSAINNSNNSDVGLPAGNYQVLLQSQNAKSINNAVTALGTDVLNNSNGNQPITIDANSLLTDGTGYKVDVTKNTSHDATQPNITGISNISVDSTNPAADGTYTIAATTAVQGADATGGTLMSSGAINNITIDPASTYANSDNYQIQVKDLGSNQYEFDLLSGPAPGTPVETVSATVSSNAGATQIQLGDISFSVDNSKFSNGSFDGNTINLSIGNQVSVTESSTGDVQTTGFLASGTNQTETLTFKDGGKLSFDVNDQGADTLTTGSNGITSVSTDNSWNVQMYNPDGTTRGSAVTLQQADVTDPSKITNIQVGNAGDGLLFDLDGQKLQSMSSDSTSTIDFDVKSGTAITAQVQDMNGNPYGNAVALTGTTAGSIVDLGNNVKLTYDGSNPGTSVQAGDVAFTVNDITPENYQMSLKQDTNGDGVYDQTLVNNVPFNLGDDVTLPGSGVKVQTSVNTTDADNATFTVENGVNDNSAKLQIGANTGQTVSLEIQDMRSKALDISTDSAGGGEQTVKMLNGSTQQVWYTTDKEANNGVSNDSMEYSLDVSSNTKASAAISVLDDAIQRVSSQRAQLGAIQNRLQYTVNNLQTMSQNVTASESQITDVDMALEMTNYTKNNILSQSAQAMLAQANQLPQGVLQLLK